MTKAELASAISEKAEITKKQAEAALDALKSTVSETLGNGDKITLRGFGTFQAKERAEKKGINPATKQPMTIPAKTVATFKFSSDFNF